MIDRFGIEAVTGRKTFYMSELRHMIHAENIVDAHRKLQASTNWDAFTLDNPRMSEILVEAIKLCQNPS